MVFFFHFWSLRQNQNNLNPEQAHRKLTIQSVFVGSRHQENQWPRPRQCQVLLSNLCFIQLTASWLRILLDWIKILLLYKVKTNVKHFVRASKFVFLFTFALQISPFSVYLPPHGPHRVRVWKKSTWYCHLQMFGLWANRWLTQDRLLSGMQTPFTLQALKRLGGSQTGTRSPR